MVCDVYIIILCCFVLSTVSMEETDLDHACNENCSCTTTSYDPVCGADDVQYFTPCYAGCTNKHDQDENTVRCNAEIFLYKPWSLKSVFNLKSS